MRSITAVTADTWYTRTHWQPVTTVTVYGYADRMLPQSHYTDTLTAFDNRHVTATRTACDHSHTIRIHWQHLTTYMLRTHWQHVATVTLYGNTDSMRPQTCYGHADSLWPVTLYGHTNRMSDGLAILNSWTLCAIFINFNPWCLQKKYKRSRIWESSPAPHVIHFCCSLLQPRDGRWLRQYHQNTAWI